MYCVCWYTWFLLFIDCTHELNNHNLSLRYDRHYRNIPLQREKQVLKICFYYKSSFHWQDKFWMEWTTFQKKKKCVNCLFNSWCKRDNFTIRVCKKPPFNLSYKWNMYVYIYTEWIPEMKTHKSCLWYVMYYINIFSYQIIEFLEMCFVDQKSGY